MIVFQTLSGHKKLKGVYNRGDPPLSIPNREVKSLSADGTAERWESRLAPNSESRMHMRLFFYIPLSKENFSSISTISYILPSTFTVSHILYIVLLLLLLFLIFSASFTPASHSTFFYFFYSCIFISLYSFLFLL